MEKGKLTSKLDPNEIEMEVASQQHPLAMDSHQKHGGLQNFMPNMQSRLANLIALTPGNGKTDSNSQKLASIQLTLDSCLKLSAPKIEPKAMK